LIQKCNHPNCTKAGTCRAPKSRDLSEYYFFCRDHAAEYNKNWNFYQNMTEDEINADWEKRTFGTPLKDKKEAQVESAEYLDFLNKFLSGKSEIRNQKSEIDSKTINAFKTLELPITATLREVRTAYRRLAKKYHPDTAKKMSAKTAAEKFGTVALAYKKLELYFKK